MKRTTVWLALPLLWLATALRFLRLDAQSFWNDEGNSARLAERSVALIVEGAAGDVHPPLYYLLLAGWRQLLGDGEFELRALSAFAGVLLVAGVIALGRLGRRRPALGAAGVGGLLAAVHPALVYYSQETRMYALLGLWAVLSTLLLWRLLPVLGKRQGKMFYVWAAGYVAITVAGLYTHYFYPVVLAAQGVVVGIGDWGLGIRDWRLEIGDWFRRVMVWAGIVVGAVVLYLPWLPVFLRQTGGRQVDGMGAEGFLAGAGRWLVLGETGGNRLWWVIGGVWVLVVVGVLAGRGLENGATRERREERGLETAATRRLSGAVQVVMAPGAILLLGATRPAYFKFLIVAAPFVALLAGWGAAAGWQWAARRAAAVKWALRAGVALLLGLALWGSGQALQNLYFDPAYARADYRGMAARIAAEGHENAAIVLNAANQWEVFTYYHRDGAPVYPIPRGQPDEGRIAQELAQVAMQHERIYALFWGEDERDPQRLVERWLDANTFKAREEWVGDVRFVTYASPPEATSEMAVESGAQFGEAITLEGYTLQGAQGAAPGDIVQVTLFWQATAAVQRRYKVFLHLVNGEGPPLAQRDAEPVGNLAPTTAWEVGETVIDNHGLLLPQDLPPGEYQLYAGLYDLEDTAARLPVDSGGDRYLLGTIAVR